ncbi:MAG: hypothetical protein J6A58_06800 [Oscillospiraceae bacterium]|nr:hypothetical protein [Oscillospiraceae bacterium]
MKIESKTVQIPAELFVQLIRYFGNIITPDSDPEQEERRRYITSELCYKFESLKRREDYKTKHSL